MSANVLGDRALRRLRRLTGLDLERALVFSDGRIAYGRTPADEHYRIDRRTGAYELEDPPQHWTSCPREEPGA